MPTFDDGLFDEFLFDGDADSSAPIEKSSSDTLAIGIDEFSYFFFEKESSDVLAIGIPGIRNALEVTLSSNDTIALSLEEASSIRVAMSSSDTLAIAATEASAIVATNRLPAALDSGRVVNWSRLS